VSLNRHLAGAARQLDALAKLVVAGPAFACSAKLKYAATDAAWLLGDAYVRAETLI
jgi:hypothetical protein